MYRFLPAPLLGVVAATLVCANTLVVGSVLLALAVLKIAVPNAAWRHFWTRVLTALAETWVRINKVFLAVLLPTRLELRGLDDPRLRKNGRFLIVSNHRSWADIPILQSVLLDRVPFLRFFLKQELIWVPVLGLAWWALDMPFMKRYAPAVLEAHPELRGKDLETTRKACERFRRGPVSILNFVEGTRFTPGKHAAQGSPFRHLLKPKAGGVASVLDALSGDLDTIVDVTVVYGGDTSDFWDFLCGRVPRVTVEVRVESIPVELRGGDYAGNAEYRERFQTWIGDMWTAKDARIAALTAPSRS